MWEILKKTTLKGGAAIASIVLKEVTVAS